MKVLGVHGSPRKAASDWVLRYALDIAAELEGVETQFEALAKPEIKPCIHCNKCLAAGCLSCSVFENDGMARLYRAVQEADVLIVAAPVYQMAPSAQTQIFMNRLRPLGKLTSQGGPATKVGVPIAIGGRRNGGEETTLEVLNRFFLSQGMCLAGGGVFSYNGAAIWSQNSAAGAQADEEGLKALRICVRRAVVTARLLKSGLEQNPQLSGVQLAGFASEADRDAYVAAFHSLPQP